MKIIARLLLVFALFAFAFATKSQSTTKGTSVLTVEKSVFSGTKALIVGVSDYMNISPLNYAHSDALNFYHYLISDAGGNVDSNNVVLLLNEEATSANIYAGLDWLVDESKPGDRIVIYFSGHGDLESKTVRQNGFLLGYDAPQNCYMAGGTISVRFLEDYLETIALQCQSDVLLIADACRSGKLAGGEEGAQNTAAALSQNWQHITKVLSSQAGEFSLESDKWGNGAGVFTYYLVNGLTGLADRNHNNEIATQELYMYLLENIGRETNYSQNPTLVGNMTATLARVDSLSLAQLQENINTGTNELLALKGIEDRFKSQLDEATYQQYTRFRQCIENDWLIPELFRDANAWDIYQNLMANEQASVIHNHVKRSLLAALQNKSQVVINLFLESKDAEDSVNIAQAGIELSYAFDMIDPDYILYNDIKARYLLFKSLDFSIDEQITLLEEATILMPDAAYLYSQLGSAYRDAKRYDSALASCRKAITLSPSYAYAYNNMGITYSDLQQYDKAIEAYQKAIELKPNHATAYSNLGNTYYDLQHYDKAIQAYLKAIELKPDDALAYYNLGNTYDDQGQYEEAIEVYQRAIELNPDNFSTYNNLGVTYNHLEQFDKAASCFQQAMILDSLNNFNYYTALGYAYFGMDSNKLALSAFERAVELAPDNPWNYYNICRLYALQEDIPNAMIWLEISLMKGFHDWVQIDFDTYLDSIRNREEFKKLIDFYEKKNGTPN